jgi:tetratricopeptide (TPR) repeat protein
MNRPANIITVFIFLILIGGCSATPQNITANTPPLAETPTAEKKSAAPPRPIEYRPFPIDTLYSLLIAEIAASRQDFKLTLETYIEQATITNDRAVIARAARIAQFFREHQASLDMGLLWLVHEPDNIEAITIIANAYLEQGNPLAALDYTEKLLKEDASQQANNDNSKDGGAFAETIANFSKPIDQDTRNRLIQRFEQLALRYPHFSGIKVGLSILYQSNGAIDQAFEWVNQALSQEPNRTSAIIQEMLLLQQNKQSELALSKLKIKLDEDPSNSRLRLIYARLLSSTDITAAYEQFTLLSEQSPQQLDLQFSRAILATELGKMAEAKPIFEQLLTANYQVDAVHFYLGHTEEALHNLGSALSHYLSVSEGENFLPARNRAARVMLQQGKTADAQDVFTRLRQQLPDKKEQIYITESGLLVQHDANDAALALLNTAITEFPDNASLRYDRSTVYERKDQIVLMESDLRHVLNLDPDNIHALNGLGYLLTIHTERYQEAYELIARALALKPTDPAIIDSMGWVEFKLGRIDEAIVHLKKAFTLFPDPEVAAHLGEALWSKGNKEEAIQIWKTNLLEHPNAPEIMDTIKRLGVSL